MTFEEPKKWCSWLPLAEWWYNTTYHTSTKFTPFQALYCYPPPMINEIAVPGPTDADAQDFLREQQHMVSILKEHLTQAQARMKKYADKTRLEDF